LELTGAIGQWMLARMSAENSTVDPDRVVVYSTALCPYCLLARRLLRRRRIEYRELKLSRDQRDRLVTLSGGGRTFPQIVIAGEAIGGFAELRRLDRAGELQSLAPST
jgi:glutaredoxin 3